MTHSNIGFPQLLILEEKDCLVVFTPI